MSKKMSLNPRASLPTTRPGDRSRIRRVREYPHMSKKEHPRWLGSRAENARRLCVLPAAVTQLEGPNTDEAADE